MVRRIIPLYLRKEVLNSFETEKQNRIATLTMDRVERFYLKKIWKKAVEEDLGQTEDNKEFSMRKYLIRRKWIKEDSE